MRIAMARGDIHYERFVIANPDGTQAEIDFDKVYFTVKKSFKETRYIFQKKLSDGTIEKLSPGDYQVKITPEDTAGMPFGNYVFDIQVQFGDTIKQTFPGEFAILNEATYPENE